MKKIVIVAGDKSGDLYGGFLSKKLKELFKDKIELYSFGGSYLKENSHQIINLLDYSVSGIFEVVFTFKKILSIFKRTMLGIEEINPDLIILIDFPDFNLRLAQKINKRYPIFYYVSPQVWAWRKKRIETIRKYIERLIVIFKFEKEFYSQYGIETLYFGHPLLEIIKVKNIKPRKVITFLPGSRINEIKNHLPLMIKTKNILKNQLPDYNFRIIRAENIPSHFYKKFMDKDTEIIEHSYQLLEESEFIITSSGTATLEIAILEVPFCVIYRLNPISWLILRNIVNIPYIAMANIVGERKIVQEFTQYQANPKNLAHYTLKILKDKKIYQNLKEGLKQVKEQLLPFGAAQNIAKYIGNFLNLP